MPSFPVTNGNFDYFYTTMTVHAANKPFDLNNGYQTSVLLTKVSLYFTLFCWFAMAPFHALFYVIFHYYNYYNNHELNYLWVFIYLFWISISSVLFVIAFIPQFLYNIIELKHKSQMIELLIIYFLIIALSSIPFYFVTTLVDANILITDKKNPNICNTVLDCDDYWNIFSIFIYVIGPGLIPLLFFLLINGYYYCCHCNNSFECLKIFKYVFYVCCCCCCCNCCNFYNFCNCCGNSNDDENVAERRLLITNESETSNNSNSSNNITDRRKIPKTLKTEKRKKRNMMSIFKNRNKKNKDEGQEVLNPSRLFGQSNDFSVRNESHGSLAYNLTITHSGSQWDQFEIGNNRTSTLTNTMTKSFKPNMEAIMDDENTKGMLLTSPILTDPVDEASNKNESEIIGSKTLAEAEISIATPSVVGSSGENYHYLAEQSTSMLTRNIIESGAGATGGARSRNSEIETNRKRWRLVDCKTFWVYFWFLLMYFGVYFTFFIEHTMTATFIRKNFQWCYLQFTGYCMIFKWFMKKFARWCDYRRANVDIRLAKQRNSVSVINENENENENGNEKGVDGIDNVKNNDDAREYYVSLEYIIELLFSILYWVWLRNYLAFDTPPWDIYVYTITFHILTESTETNIKMTQIYFEKSTQFETVYLKKWLCVRDDDQVDEIDEIDEENNEKHDWFWLNRLYEEIRDKSTIVEWRIRLSMDIFCRFYASIITGVFQFTFFLCMGKDFYAQYYHARNYDRALIFTFLSVVIESIHFIWTFYFAHKYYQLNPIVPFLNYVLGMNKWNILLYLLITLSFLEGLHVVAVTAIL